MERKVIQDNIKEKSINWRNIKDETPTDTNIGYLVSDGETIEYSDLSISNKSLIWIGGSVFPTYDGRDGTTFDYEVKYWAPVSELNLPE